MTILAANPEFLDSFNTFIKQQRSPMAPKQLPQHVELIDDETSPAKDPFSKFFAEKLKRLREQEPNLHDKAYERIAREMWGNLTPQQRAAYEDSKKACKVTKTEDVAPKVAKPGKLKVRKFAPDQVGPVSPYCLFIREKFKEIKADSSTNKVDRKEAMQIIGQEWRVLTDAQKMAYRE